MVLVQRKEVAVVYILETFRGFKRLSLLISEPSLFQGEVFKFIQPPPVIFDSERPDHTGCLSLYRVKSGHVLDQNWAILYTPIVVLLGCCTK